MARLLRIGFTLIVVLIVGLVAAAGVFVYTADYNRYKGLIEKAVTDATGRQLDIKGGVEIAMSLSPELAVRDVTLANAPWGSQPQMAHIGQLRVRIRLIPLLRREVDITGIRLIDTDLLLETDASGRANWHFDREAGLRSGAGMRGVAVRRLDVEQLAVGVRSGETGEPAAHYELDRLELTRSEAGDSLGVELQGNLNGQPVALSGQTGPLRDLFAGARFPLELSGDVAGATVKFQGGIDNPLTLEGLDLTIQALGSDLAALGKAVAVKLPETHGFAVTAHVTGSRDDLTLQEVHGSVSHQTFKLAADGVIGNLNVLKGIQLELKGSGNNLAELSSIIGRNLPRTGRFEVSSKLTGTAETLSLIEAQGTVSHKSMKVSVTGRIGNLIAVEDLDLNLKGSGNDLAELSAIADKTVPQTGPFEFSGKLTGTAEALTLSEARGTISHQSMKMSVTGRIDDLAALKGISLNVRGEGNNLGELRSVLTDKLPDTGPFSATARLSGSAQALAASNLRAALSQGSAQLAVSGKMADVRQFGGIDLDVEGSGRNLAELGPLFDTQLPDLGPFSIEGQLSGSGTLLDLKNFSAKVDETDFAGWAKVQFGKRPKLTARLESGLVDFTRMMEQAKRETKAEKGKPERGEAGGSRQALFSDAPLPFDLLDALDADIAFNARNIKARDAALEIGQLALRLDAGDLSVEKLEATYRGTKISANLNLTAANPSKVSIRFLVQNFDLGRFLKETHTSQDIEGQVDLAADLKSQGNSLHGLMANLDGTTGAVIGKGYVPRYLDLLAEDLSSRVIPI